MAGGRSLVEARGRGKGGQGGDRGGENVCKRGGLNILFGAEMPTKESESEKLSLGS